MFAANWTGVPAGTNMIYFDTQSVSNSTQTRFVIGTDQNWLLFGTLTVTTTSGVVSFGFTADYSIDLVALFTTKFPQYYYDSASTVVNVQFLKATTVLIVTDISPIYELSFTATNNTVQNQTIVRVFEKYAENFIPRDVQIKGQRLGVFYVNDVTNTALNAFFDLSDTSSDIITSFGGVSNVGPYFADDFRGAGQYFAFFTGDDGSLKIANIFPQDGSLGSITTRDTTLLTIQNPWAVFSAAPVTASNAAQGSDYINNQTITDLHFTILSNLDYSQGISFDIELVLQQLIPFAQPSCTTHSQYANSNLVSTINIVIKPEVRSRRPLSARRLPT